MSAETIKLISTVESLPIDIKTALKEIDKLWAKEAERRLSEIKTGKVKTIPGDEVFKEIHKKYHK